MIGTQVGNYRITGNIGEGGMAVVYRAEHVHLRSPAAVKVLASNLARSEAIRERFTTEAAVMAQLRHPNIVTVLDFVVDRDLLAIVMEYVDGESLDEMLRRRGRAFSPLEAWPIMRGVLRAVGHAHGQGIVHRDLKPSNVMLTTIDGELTPKVLDFGLAKILGEGPQRTRTGTKMGTLWYMSPEQCRGSKQIGPAADVYALGITLFEMLTGRVPFDAESEYDILRGHLELEPPRPTAFNPRLPAAVEAVVLRALAKDPAARPDAQEFAQALDRAVSASPPTPAARAASTVVEQPASTPRAAPTVVEERKRPTGGDVMKAVELCGKASMAEKNQALEDAWRLFDEAARLDPSNEQARAGAQRVAARVVEARRRAARAEFETLLSSALREAAAGSAGKVAAVIARLRALVSANAELRDEGARAEAEVEAAFLSCAAKSEQGGDLRGAMRLIEEAQQALGGGGELRAAWDHVAARVREIGMAGVLLLEADGLAKAERWKEALQRYAEAQAAGADAEQIRERRAAMDGARVPKLLLGGDEHVRAARWKEALARYAEAEALGADTEQLRSRRAALHLACGREALKGGQPGVALEQFELGAQQAADPSQFDPHRAAALIALASVALKEGNLQGALMSAESVPARLRQVDAAAAKAWADLVTSLVQRVGERGDVVQRAQEAEPVRELIQRLSALAGDGQPGLPEVRARLEGHVQRLRHRRRTRIIVGAAAAFVAIVLIGVLYWRYHEARRREEADNRARIAKEEAQHRAQIAEEEAARRRAEAEQEAARRRAEAEQEAARRRAEAEAAATAREAAERRRARVAAMEAGWVTVRAGSFEMGSPGTEPGRWDDEVRHTVTLTRGFLMSSTEVTQAEFEEWMGYNPSSFGACGGSCPVETVNWHEAAAYCNALSAGAGLGLCYSCSGAGRDVTCEPSASYPHPYACPGYRLPTEAEWEYAARAGTTTATYNGTCDARHLRTDCAPLASIAWFSGNSEQRSHKVAGKTANAWGLYDMLGNVWEWCGDWYASCSGGSATDPWGPSAGSSRVFRGGSWANYASGARAGHRYGYGPGSRNGYFGFRPVRSLP